MISTEVHQTLIKPFLYTMAALHRIPNPKTFYCILYIDKKLVQLNSIDRRVEFNLINSTRTLVPT